MAAMGGAAGVGAVGGGAVAGAVGAASASGSAAARSTGSASAGSVNKLAPIHQPSSVVELSSPQHVGLATAVHGLTAMQAQTGPMGAGRLGSPTVHSASHAGQSLGLAQGVGAQNALGQDVAELNKLAKELAALLLWLLLSQDKHGHGAELASALALAAVTALANDMAS
jgi:hypothetical protein